VAWVFWQRPVPGPAPSSAAAESSVQVASDREPTRSRPGQRPRADDVGRDFPTPPPVDVWGFRADVGKIRARWDSLFPFVTTPMTFDLAAVAERAQQAGSLAFVDPRRAPARLERSPPALTLSPAAMQRLVDRSWTRRDRWSRFGEIAALTGRYHPDDGRLPALIRSYVEQNLLQPYEEMSLADPRRWVMLMLAADDRDYLDFATSYVRAHPRTRTSTELLFLIDALMQGNGNALLLLLETDPRRDLVWTAHENPQAWVLFDAVRDHYRDRFGAEGIPAPTAVRQRYDAARLRLLTTVLRLTPDGYRAADAHFAIGRIRWTQGDRAAAMREWRLIRVDPRDAFVASYAPLVQALAVHDADSPDPVTVAHIEAIFTRERQRWAAFHQDRLSRFHFAPYTF
jgi:hypothetical protein